MRLKNLKTGLIILFKLLLTASAFYIIYRKVTFNPFIYLNKSNLDYFIFAFSLSILLIFLQTWRWKAIVKMYGINLPFSQSLIAVWFGHLVNNFFPAATAGDLLRSYTLRFADNENRKWKWLGGYLSEKYSTASSALLLSCLALTTSIAKHVPTLLIIFIYLFFISLILLPLIATKIISAFDREKFKKILIYLHEISKALSNTFTHKNGRDGFIISFMTAITMCLVFYVIAMGLSVHLPIAECLFVVPVFTILASLPISFAGWGVRELSCVSLMGFFGTSSEIALIISVMYGLIIMLSSLPGILLGYSFVLSMRPVKL